MNLPVFISPRLPAATIITSQPLNNRTVAPCAFPALSRRWMVNLSKRLAGVLSASLLAMMTASANEPVSPASLVENGNNAFAFVLYAGLKQEKGNLFFSPYSLSSALAMTYGGARGGTAEEMAKVLHFEQEGAKVHTAFATLNKRFATMQQHGIELHTANSLWPQQGDRLQPEYLTMARNYYGASITPLDFSQTNRAAKTINRWVENATNHRIRELIRPGDLSPSTVLALVNAIYFKGEWATPFDPKLTRQARFSLANKTRSSVAMMARKGRYRYGKFEHVQLLELPYTAGQLSMAVILPDEAVPLARIEDALSASQLEAWLAHLSEEEVNVHLPRFTITWGTYDIGKTLQALGLRKPFTTDADFSGIDGSGKLYLGSVLHKALVEVNEEGSEAAAATAVMTKRGFSQPLNFNADHPFLFLIRDRTTGTILFLGRVVDPGK